MKSPMYEENKTIINIQNLKIDFKLIAYIDLIKRGIKIEIYLCYCNYTLNQNFATNQFNLVIMG